LRFLSRFAKTGLGIVPFGGTLRLHTYTFKQPILSAAGFPAGAWTRWKARPQARLPAPHTTLTHRLPRLRESIFAG